MLEELPQIEVMFPPGNTVVTFTWKKRLTDDELEEARTSIGRALPDVDCLILHGGTRLELKADAA